MECSKCASRYREKGEIPLCHTDEGCPIQAEATNPTIHKLIDGYTRYKHLNNAGAPDSLQLHALRQAGALDLCPDLLVELEPIWFKVKEKAIEEEKERREKEQEYKERVNKAKRKAKGR